MPVPFTFNMKYKNLCKVCGNEFYVDQKCKSDPKNKRKFVRCCSKECTSKIKSQNMKKLHEEGLLERERPEIVTKLDRDTLIDLYCYKYWKIQDIAKHLKVKYSTVSREMKRLNVPKKFYRNCPYCGKEFSCNKRSMVDENSKKFKKFCSRKCFLSSRKQNNTWIELEVQNMLDELNISYIKQYEVKRMTVDFYIPDNNLAIEVNGDFWHCNPDIYGKIKPLHKIHPRVIEKDKRKKQQLYEEGIDLHVVWENELLNNKQEVKSSLSQII